MQIRKKSFDTGFKNENMQRKTSIGNQIMVGFIAKTKTEKAKSKLMFLFPDIISFKIIKEKIITGRSGLGDWEKSNKIGRKHS
jgi:hypothetical protein